MKFKVGDKVRIKKNPKNVWEIAEIKSDWHGDEYVACMLNKDDNDEVFRIPWLEDDLEYAEDNIERTTDMGRTETQKEIDSWIAKEVQTDALDKYIKVQLAEYPEFSKFKDTDVLNAIETVYLEIEPEEQYDPWIWTTVVERALAMLEPNKDKRFKIELKDFGDYVQELIVGHTWISHNLSVANEKKCFRMGINDHIEDVIDFDNYENVPFVITRIS